MKGRMQRLTAVTVAAAMGLTAPAVLAQEDEDQGPGFFESIFGTPDIVFGYGGYLRNELAIKITDEENPYNQSGNPYNRILTQRNGALPAVPAALAIQDMTRRPVPYKENSINLEYLRGELDLDLKITSNLRFEASIRAIADPDLYNNLDPEQVPGADPVGTLQRNPNLFEYRYEGGPVLGPQEELAQGVSEAEDLADIQSESGSGYLEWAGAEYMVDFSQAYFDYGNAGLVVRLGVQQIAWGDLLFFRILDVPNGLDLRRHSVLDFVTEEFSDKRVPSLGLRVSYLLPFGFPVFEGWEIDSYVQRFRSTILGNPNTPYNVIPSQFTVRDEYKQYDDEYNYGVRFRGPAGPFNIQILFNRRYNHFGVFQWTDADVVQGLQPLSPGGVGGALVNSIQGILGSLGGQGLANTTDFLNFIQLPATGAILADTPFEVDPTGVISGNEFSTFGALVYLNHFTGLNQAITEFPAAAVLGAMPASSAAEQERQEDLFFQASGGLRGHISRDYYRENNFGLGIGYLYNGPQEGILGLFLDSVNIDVEMKYTPDRHYTPTNLTPSGIENFVEDEFEIGVVAQKFIRFSPTFPSMFAILQYYYRSDSDLFNRLVSGYGGDPFADDPADRIPTGISNWQAVAFAFQQPFPNRIWIIDGAWLQELRGGALFQLGFRYQPSAEWTFQVFGTVVETLFGEPTENAVHSVEFADEITTRITYQF